jgi:hypothetical protein
MFTYDFIPNFATGKNRIVRFRSSKRNKQNGGQLNQAQFGMQKGDTYDPYAAKAAEASQNVNMMNQYQANMQQNKSNMANGLESALRQNFIMDNQNKLKSFFDNNLRSFLNKKQLEDLSRFTPKYTMDSATGAVTIQEPTFKTDPAEYGQGGGYMNDQYMYYAQGGMEVPRQEDFPDYNSFAAAMQEWEQMGQYNNYMNSPAMMADSIPIAQPVVGVPPAAVPAQAAQVALNPYQGSSVYDFLSAQNKAADYTSRKALASQLGIKNYRGTAAQNLQMISMLQQSPDLLQSYTPSTAGKSSKTVTVIDQQGNPVQVPADSTSTPKDTTTSRKTPILPKKQSNETENGYVAKVLGIVGATAAAGGLTYLESQAMLKYINSGAFKLSDAAKAKITQAVENLTAQTATNATKGIKDVADWFKGLPLRQRNILKTLDAAEIPGVVHTLKSGTAANDLSAWKMLQEANAESSILNRAEAANAIDEAAAESKALRSFNAKKSAAARQSKLVQNISDRTSAALAAVEGEEAYMNALEKAKGEAKALRSFNAQKAAAIRWGKPVPKFPTLPGAAAKSENAFMGALREASAAATETPWLRNTLKFMKRMPKFQEGGEPDSLGENILEWVDPTGISSWDDVRRSYNDPNAAWWETGLEMAGAIPVFGKLGKAGKAVKAAATAGKATKASKVANVAKKVWTGTGKTLDWVGGAAPQRFIDQSINPLTRGMGVLTARGLQNAPSWVGKTASFIQPLQQGQRFWKGVGDVTGSGLGMMRVPEPVNEQVNIMMPDGSIVPMSSTDPELSNLVNQNMIDTAQGTGYDANTNSWKARKGIKYKGKKYKNGGYYNPMTMMAEGGEPNGGMALGQISSVADKMNKLRQFVSPEQNLDPWIASKLAVMDHSANAISDYMMYNPESQGEEMEMEEQEMRRGGSTFSGNAWYRNGGTNNPGFRALPDFVQNQILSNMAYGGIQIDPAKRGTFKAQATRMGMGVQEAASAILNAPEGKYSPAMRKKANFAKNFAKQQGGQVLDVTPEELEMLRQQGYQFEIM